MRRKPSWENAAFAPPKATRLEQSHSYESGDTLVEANSTGTLPDTPERRFLRALLQGAFLDLRDLWRFRHSGGWAGVTWWNTYRWVLSEDRSYFTACASVCDALGIEHTYIQLSLRRWIASRVRAQEIKVDGTASPATA